MKFKFVSDILILYFIFGRLYILFLYLVMWSCVKVSMRNISVVVKIKILQILIIYIIGCDVWFIQYCILWFIISVIIYKVRGMMGKFYFIM